MQRPDGKGEGHAQGNSLGTEERICRAIVRQSLVPNLHFMKKVSVENNKRVSVVINKIHIGF